MNEKILLVDDAKFARKVAIKSLQNGGFDNVIQAATAAETMELFEKEKPDLVLLDITLPDNSDLTLLENLLKKKPDAKIIMTSAIGQDLIIEDSIKAGAKAFVTKPYLEKEFLEVIYKVLEEKEV
ncbi:MAG: response regulator [Lachnospiraceae bacterium]|mgnify:CR=1 FL=1